MFKRILIPVDGSEPSFKAVEIGGDLADKYGADCFALIVTQSSKVPEELQRFAEVEHIGGPAQQVYQKIAENIMRTVRARLEKKGITDVQFDIREGDPARKIQDYIQAHGIDLVVMGTVGHSSLEELFVGSVSHDVARAVDCTSIIVK